MNNTSVVLKPRRKPAAFMRRYGRVMVGGGIVGVIILIAVFAPLLSPYDPGQVDMTSAKALPSALHPFGTDVYGRDLMSRVFYGARVTLIIAVGVQVFTVLIGSTCGLLCGYYRRVDIILMRIMEGVNAIPQILLALVIASVLGAGPVKLMISLVVSGLPNITRTVRSLVLSLRQKEFVESEKAMGANDLRTIFLHILPHCYSYLIIRLNTGLASTILSLTSLSYLGVGLDPTIPNWGAIIADGQSLMLLYLHLILSPGLAICITVFGFCMLGDGLRDILDPKLR